jgi:quinol monooxygenase YgiN
MNEPLTIIATLRARPGQESRAREALRGMLTPTLAEAGCIDYDLHESLNDPALFVFYENWTTAAHLDAHLKTSHFQALAKLIPEIFTGPPEITKWKKVS